MQAGRAVIAALAANLLGGASYVLTKVALAGFGDATLVLVRTVVALVVLVPLCGRRLLPVLRAPGASRWQLLAMGVAGYALPLVLASYGVRRSTATNASLLISMEPLAVVLLGAVVLCERLSGRRVIALVLGLVGTSILVSDGIPLLTTAIVPHPVGDALLVASGFAWGIYTIAGKHLLKRYDAVVVSTASLVVAFPVLAVQAALEGAPVVPGPAFPAALMAACALGLLVSALMTVLWNAALRAMDASRLAGFVFLQPVTGVALSALALGEVLSPWVLVGGGLVLAGVGIASREP